ncbi:peptide-methionine (R)-S-oxide reductase MsrB [Novosphingobium mangrovi (ex Huang et al. 2023)]|uniref:peptide-methionine (R)-S-oxide reductase n=1 Tax=Novosphingobium mangrovi (ex Huang et al. 2023) TaxID=2976432 RepID=A0ABT2I1A9_9SPHN|nr:peptide-methionine (R)-S-oxide reductase MsrB [Novosphingobium mangrovi (ex Huang et al. 2023)]MCT2398590.1 peptide-methionine (R)-S-oxide reductase MsrB [Novosphingobium mangrovi (ex Huang et al. 2023)]
MSPTATRRRFLGWLGAGAALPVLAACGGGDAEAKTYPVHYTKAEWRKRLTPAQFTILREEGTERPYSSPLNDEHRAGTFLCAADGNPLYSSKTKYDSHTGWPSFWKPLPGAIGTSTDYKLGYPRTEVHCARCGGHLGHVFNDGPPPTGKRYCMNGAAMAFKPA